MTAWLLDSSALLILRDDELGAERVADPLAQQRKGGFRGQAAEIKTTRSGWPMLNRGLPVISWGDMETLLKRGKPVPPGKVGLHCRTRPPSRGDTRESCRSW